MNGLQHFPLGIPLPGSTHSVCVSLPRMEDVIGYEEKRPETLAAMRSGYPRFYIHRYINKVGDWLMERHGLKGGTVFPVSSESQLAGLAGWTGEGCRTLEADGVYALHVPDDADLHNRAKAFCQHTGCLISSRQAEDFLCAHGLLEKPEAEEARADDADRHVRQTLAGIYGAETDDVSLCPTGMSAFHAVYQGVSDFQQRRLDDRRKVWIQLGWLYVDTICILEEFGPNGGGTPLQIYNVLDLGELESVLAERGAEVAGIIVEAPTNPLVQTSDLQRVRELADKHDVMVVIDPTIASPANIDVLSYADVVVNSLTKYAGIAGDLILGAFVFNRNAPHYDGLKAAVMARREKPYLRDVQRLAVEIDGYRENADIMNRNTMALAEFLQLSPAVKDVYWAYREDTRANYEKIERAPYSPGCIITVTFNKPLKEIYDPARVVKSPSFGTDFTIMSPYMYLAHFDLVSTESGRRYLHEHGIEPDLMRLSVGTEDTGAIIEAFSEIL